MFLINTSCLIQEKYKLVYLLIAVAFSLNTRITGYNNRLWNPHVVNEACPVFVVSETGPEGLGDELEHYIYTLFVAKKLQATLIVDGFNVEGGRHHTKKDEYRNIALMLGINFDLNVSDLSSRYGTKLKTKHLSYDEVLEENKNMIQLNKQPDCYTVHKSSVHDCGWCFQSKANLDSQVIWTLRNNNARHSCQKRMTDTQHFSLKKGVVNIVWHVRASDLFLHADKLDYYLNISNIIENAVTNGKTSLRAKHVNHVFESRGEYPVLNELKQAFPSATFNTNSELIDSVCTILLSDIFVSGGSSLNQVTSFSPPFRPIVLEEMRKDAGLVQHTFNEDEAILLQNGVPTISVLEAKTFIRTSLPPHLIVHT